MVSILFPLASVAPNGLNVRVVVRTYPDVGPCRRNCKRANACQSRRVANQSSTRTDVPKAFACADAPYAGGAVGHMPQAGQPSGGNGVRSSKFHINLDRPSKIGSTSVHWGDYGNTSDGSSGPDN